MSAPFSPAPAAHSRPNRWRQALPWAALIALLFVVQAALIWLTVRYEHTRMQEQLDHLGGTLAGELMQAASQDVHQLQALLWNDQGAAQWRADAADLLRRRPELLRVEWRDADLDLREALDSPFSPTVFAVTHRESVTQGAELACVAAQRLRAPTLSRSYFVPGPEGLGLEVVDICVPVASSNARGPGSLLVATLGLSALLETVTAPATLNRHEVTLLDGDGARLARAGRVRGAGTYTTRRLVDLPGLSMTLQLDSVSGNPQAIPHLSTALVAGLSLALFGVMSLLMRDVRMRSVAERQLAESLAFRKAMEDSLVTGLRARDLEGRVTYVNPAFCDMVGFRPQELVGRDPPPYWPPEMENDYRRRQLTRMAEGGPPREGYETIFMRRNGERFPVLIFEAPLVDADGRQTGWMSTALDQSEQRRAEELTRQQNEKLQATARLATVGEMASLLSHELNQPLAAISSYATGSLNLMGPPTPDAETLGLIRQATERIAEQAQRAGRVIKSVHDFVRRRDPVRESIRTNELFDAVLPLVKLMARKGGTRIDVALPAPAPRVLCDRTMVEQLLLNLTRNAIQAMDTPATPLSQRVLTLAASWDEASPRRVVIRVRDCGPGIADEVGAKLFTPFFTTKAEGMGLGLSLCRTVAEQHGGTLGFETLRDATGTVLGTEFRFTLATP